MLQKELDAITGTLTQLESQKKEAQKRLDELDDKVMIVVMIVVEVVVMMMVVVVVVECGSNDGIDEDSVGVMMMKMIGSTYAVPVRAETYLQFFFSPFTSALSIHCRV